MPAIISQSGGVKMVKKSVVQTARLLGVLLLIVAFILGAASNSNGSSPMTVAAGSSTDRPVESSAPTNMNKAPLLAKCVLPKGWIQFAAPAVGDLDHSGALAIVVGTSDGWVYAVKPSPYACTVLWQFDVAAAMNALAQAPSPATIRGAPAIADLDRDGWNEVIVSVGTVIGQNQNGGVVVLTHDGKLMSGWPQLTFAYYTAYTNGIVESPATADLDGDGYLEIIAGANDNRVYAWRYDGTWVRGWPRFVFDTIWSSPAVGDLDNDGLSDVVMGVDAHYDPYFGSTNGGAWYVYGPDGTERRGFPKYVNEIIQSNPTLVDLNNDDYLEMVFAGGAYYGDAATDGKKVFVWDRNGASLPGWPQTTGDKVDASPALADIDNDGALEIVVGSRDRKLYAWNLNGTLLPGWPMMPKDWTGIQLPAARSPVVANYNGGADGNSRLKVFFPSGWEITVVDANGTQLTWDGTPGNPQNKLTYYAEYLLNSTPVVADVLGDNNLELIAGGGAPEAVGSNAAIYVWALPAGSIAPAGVKDWPMFKHDSARSGYLRGARPNDATVVRHTIPAIMAPGQARQVQVVLKNAGTNTWKTAQLYRLGVSGPAFSSPARIDLPGSTDIAPGASATFTFSIVAPSTPGYYPLSVRMVREGVSAFGPQIALDIKVGNQPALYALCGAATGGGVYAGGLAPSIAPPAGYDFWSRVPAFKLGRLNTGYYALDSTGFQARTSGAQDLGVAGPIRPNLVELVMGPDRQGFYAIDNNGNLAHTSGAMDIPALASPFGDGSATSFAVTPDYKGMYVLNRSGEIRRSGTAANLGAMTPAFSNDTAVKIKLTKDGKGYYVLGSSGRVYRGGNAPEIAPAYTLHPGEDWARDFELTSDQQGYYLLDKDGQIYPAGTAEPLTYNVPPTCSGSAAKDLELADSRVAPLAVIPSAPQVAMVAGEGGALPSAKITVNSSDPDETLNWTARLDPAAPWLSIAPTAGTTPATVDISVPSPLLVGSYATTLRVSATDGSGQEVQFADVPIALRVWENLYQTYLPTILK
jgi:hypothetical protein